MAGGVLTIGVVIGWAGPLEAQLPGEAPALGARLQQSTVINDLSLSEIRTEGRRIFSTPFNILDGLGDGPINPLDKVSPGGRPTLQNNGTFLRMNGLDSQTCLECHGVLSNRSIPAQFAVGGVAGVGGTAFPGIVDPDIDDSENNGFARVAGRAINPPFSFGSGGVEALAKEMTADLQDLKQQAQSNPGDVIQLNTHGVHFGTLVFDGSDFDTSGVEGIDPDLVVRPFGRKGCCQTVRDFDLGAMMFHHGIQPAEVVGQGVDADGDGVANELTVGELSAMHIFQTSLKRPFQRGPLTAQETVGSKLFDDLNCTNCHIPSLTTDSVTLPLSFPEVPTDPSANVFFTINLTRDNPGFEPSGSGVEVPLYADLKRHDMGDRLAEAPAPLVQTADGPERFFQTARLWGVADTAPYLHDGRAPTLSQAIEFHGGEAQGSRDGFVALSNSNKEALLAFLRTLRTPEQPDADLGQTGACSNDAWSSGTSYGVGDIVVETCDVNFAGTECYNNQGSTFAWQCDQPTWCNIEPGSNTAGWWVAWSTVEQCE